MPPIHMHMFRFTSIHPYSSAQQRHRLSYFYENARRSHKRQVELVLLWGFVECGNRKALRLRAQGVYSCK